MLTLGLGVVEIVVLLVLLFLEIGLFWAAVALGGGPEVGAGKALGVSLLVGAFCMGSTAAVTWGVVMLAGRFGFETWVYVLLSALVSVALTWALSSVLYIP